MNITNHLECECVSKTLPNRPSRIQNPVNFWTTTMRPTPRYFTEPPSSAKPITNFRTSSCKCPESYESVFANGSCECKCERSGAECRLKYEGKEGFSISDRK